MIKIKKIYDVGLKLMPCFGAVVLVACGSGTPNSVSLTATQGSCVTAAYPGYESVATAYSAAYPMNASLPATSPYCVALTLTNNNSGTNANNIQVTNSGLTVSYGAPTNTSYNLIDFNAAGINTFPYPVYQTAYNVALFDPKNCVTTTGSKVQTLNKGGNSCTFYLQLTGESLPVGVYPLNVTVNYTNGNGYYSTSIALNQRSNLYVGGNLSLNLGLTNAQSQTTSQSAANSVTSANYPGKIAVTALTRDPYGNVYAGDMVGAIYKYNGTSANSWLQMVTAAPGTPTLAMTSDASGNIYFADYGGAVYQLSAVTGTVVSLGSISSIPTTTPTSIQISADSSTLYVSAGSNIYSCSLSPVSSSSCSGTIAATAPESINQMVFTNTISIGATNNFYQYTGSNWSTPYSNLTGLDVTGIAYVGGSSPMWFAAVDETESVNSSIYYESAGTSNNFVPFAGSTGNILSGQYPQLVLDSAQGVFVSGISLMSMDFVGSTAFLAYIPAQYLGASVRQWTPITGISAQINAMQTASQLTNY